MTGAYLAVNDPDHPMFTARLGPTIAELAGGHEHLGEVLRMFIAARPGCTRCRSADYRRAR